ncbi:hypothetical protein BDB00DRAFT_872630 [Zychaea mexicana]|uniref:uncharacterized protein n=1 Tax=Zychaea mexicana TaxID=64656 RepID=UPI0022FF1C47|nr:uncharacterized protein BDB00DRAFT_872630 [Zychaea mexicana]KAI9493115.1 hypothetical protein BDB00DRAFT_872630 [Zychaea mexicana]
MPISRVRAALLARITCGRICLKDNGLSYGMVKIHRTSAVLFPVFTDTRDNGEPWNFIPSAWSTFTLPTNIQKRLYKFLLRKAIGQFLASDLDLENFDIELVNGSVELRDLSLNLERLNEWIADTPFMLEQGRVGSISASLPWSNFWNGDIALKVQGLDLTLRPTKPTRRTRAQEDDDSPIMSSSLHFADDFLRTEMEDQELMDSIQQSIHESTSADADFGTEGLQVLTRIIDKMLAKVKIDVVNTTIRILHKPPTTNSDEEYSIDLHIPRISYFDETPEFNARQTSTQPPLVESSVFLSPDANETIKIIAIASPTIWLRSNRSSLYSVPSKSETTLQKNESNDDESDLDQTEFYEANEGEGSFFYGNQSIHSSNMSGSTTPRAFPRRETRASMSTTYSGGASKPYEALLLTTMDKENWIRIKLRPSFPFNAPQSTDAPVIKQIDFLCTHICTYITPWQAAFLVDLLKKMSDVSLDPGPSEKPSSPEGPLDLLADLQQLDRKTPLENEDPHMSSRPIAASSAFPLQSAASTASTAAPQLKIKLQISTIDCYFLYADGYEPTTTHGNGFKDVSHLKLSISQVIMRHQQFHRETTKRDISIRHTPPREGTSPLPSGSPTVNSSPLSILDIRVTGFSISEWIKRPDCAKFYKELPRRIRQTQYGMYNPIFEFDESIRNDYLHETEFPSVKQQRSKNKSNKGEAIRLRVEKKQGHEVSRFVNASTLDEESSMDLQPFTLHIDAQIVDRLENYVCALMDVSSTWTSNEQVDTSAIDNTLSQRVYEDLDRASVEHQHRKKLRVKCAFIRILLFIPDMSQVCVRDEFNDLQHADTLSVDIKRLVLNWNSEVGDSDVDAGSVHSRYPRTARAETPTKLHVDCSFINVFLQLADDNAAQCWFTSKTVVPSGYTPGIPFTSSQSMQSPSFEITLRPSASSIGANPASAAKPSFFGAGSDIPNNIFEYLCKNESLPLSQKQKLPMEDQAESSMIFKQRTIETSLAVVNCHFPVTRLNLTKEVWDVFQILQNDLILWQPRFMRRLFPTEDIKESNDDTERASASIMSDIYESANSYSGDPRFTETDSVQASSVLSQSHERLGQSTNSPSLLSLVVVMSDAIWDLHHISKEDSVKTTYRLHMSEFRYFTVVKHLGLNENITTLDIDQLALDRTAPTAMPIICKSIPKKLNAKRNTSVVSLVAKLVPMPGLNKQNKITSVVACNICWLFGMELSVVDHLAGFQGIPEDMVFIDPATQYNKIYAHVFDISVDYKPLHIPSRAVIVLNDAQVTTDIISGGQPIFDVKMCVQSLNVYLMDDATHVGQNHIEQVIAQLAKRSVDANTYWCALGFICTLTISEFEAGVKIKLDELVTAPNVDIAILNNVVAIKGCSDSIHSLINFITYVANQGDIPKPHQDTKGKTPVASRVEPIQIPRKQNIDNNNTNRDDGNMLESLDPDAFKRWVAPSQINDSDTLKMDYVEGYYTSTGRTSRIAENGPPQKPLRKHRAQSRRKKEDQVRLLVEDMNELSIVENFYSTNRRVKASNKRPVDVTRSVFSVRIRNFDVMLKLYDAHDVHYANDQVPRSSNNDNNTTKESLSCPGSIDTASDNSTNTTSDLDFTPHSPTFSLSSDRSDDAFSKHAAVPKPDSKRRQGGKRESRRHFASRGDIEMRLDGLSLDLNLMPPTDNVSLYLLLKVRDYQIIDNVKTSSWHQFLGYMRPDSNELPREQGSVMLRFEVTGARPVADDPTQEFRIKLKLLPMRLYVDQDALNFLVKFFTFDKNLLRSTKYANATIQRDDQKDVASPEIFLQHVEISPIVLKIDYKPKYINYGSIKEGQLAELVNLFHLHGADIQLSQIKMTGINGFTRLADKLAQEWLPHIMNTQVPHMVSGVSPIRSIVNVGSGMADLVLLPIQQYRKDGRIVRGLQKGTQSFARATAMEAINLSARFASGAQVILEQADDFLSPSRRHEFVPIEYDADLLDQVEDDDDGFFFANAAVAAAAANEYHLYHHQKGATAMSKFANQPSDLSQGLQYAYKNLSLNLGAAAQTILAVPTEIIENGGMAGSPESTYSTSSSSSSSSPPSSSQAKAVIRAVPIAVIKPMIGLTGAFQSIMVGLRNSIDPAMRLQSEDKYKR